MFEQTGKRPVVYNNKCGQMCGVSLTLNLWILLILSILILVLRKRSSTKKNRIFFK